MDRQTFERESAIHRPLYESLREQIQQHAGRYVVLANGQLIVAATYDEARDIIESFRPIPEYYLIFPAEMEPDFDLAYDLSTFSL